MIEQEIKRDIRKYKTKFLAGFTFRECVSFAIGAALAVGLYNIQKLWTAYPSSSVCGIAVLPIAFGFLEVQGMPLEKYLMVLYNNNFRKPKLRIYQSQISFKEYLDYSAIDKDIIPEGKKSNKGIDYERLNKNAAKESSEYEIF